jgi:hypothetical protein
MYGIGEIGEDRKSDYSSDDNGEINNISRVADTSMISDHNMLINLTNQSIHLPHGPTPNLRNINQSS